MPVSPVPQGYHTYQPYYIVEGASDFIAFLQQVFGAQELMRMPMPGGRIGHAEVRIGDSVVMCADPNAEHPARRLNGMVYLPGVDAVFKNAVAAGCKVVREPSDQFYGDRMAAVTDRWGNDWSIATHIEDVSHEEMERRLAKLSHG